MNWLGEIIQKNIQPSDTVLDVGCGIFQAITNSIDKTRKYKFHIIKKPDNIICKSLLGIELIDEYIHIAKQYFPVIKMDISRIENLNIFSNKSFDIVMALDVLEHIEYNNAIHLIKRMTDIARKKVIIYTPKEFHSNEQHICNVWNIQGEFITQKHLSWIPHKVLEDMGFKITFPYPDDNTLAILILPMVMGDVKE